MLHGLISELGAPHMCLTRDSGNMATFCEFTDENRAIGPPNAEMKFVARLSQLVNG